MNNVLLEVSERDSEYASANGDYEVTLAKPVYMYEGDQMTISKIFIDTESSTDGIIDVPYDIQITGEVFLYTTNWLLSKVNTYLDGVNQNDNNDFAISLDVQRTAVHDNFLKINNLIAFRAGGRGTSWGDKDGQHPLSFTYRGVLGDSKHFSVDIPFIDAGKDVNFADINISSLGLFMEVGSLRADNQDGNWDRNNMKTGINQDDRTATGSDIGIAVTIRTDRTPAQGGAEVPNVNRNIISPLPVPFQITIPASKYVPADLCTTINDAFQGALPVGGAGGGSTRNFLPGDQLLSPFLQTTAQITAANPGQQVTAASCASTPVANQRAYVPQPQAWAGSNLIQLNFDTTDQKFYWDFLHMPIYDSNTFCTLITQFSNVVPNRFIQASKNSGIVFHKFDSVYLVPTTDAQGRTSLVNQPFDFLSDTLKFTRGTLLATTPLIQDFDRGDAIFHMEAVTINDRLSSTNAKITNDSVVDKGTQASAGAFATCPTTAPFAPIQSNLNNIIKAREAAVSGEILESGYYLIQLEAGIRNELIDKTSISYNINGIASRYYSMGSYTSTELDPTFSYTHQGEPVMVSDIRVRILNPNKTPASVGKDNSVFLELVRGEYSRQLFLTRENEPETEE